ncbi:major capsid protein P2 [Vibrio tubiashii]|uniref:Membrane protein n=1 Tax=Vibrio tubiashii ATCC 19109 TaxID=1051646 RepID=F9SZY2_9VIBR|nr:major capsid protein P2 [Vibrio tubiashii]AIW16288.1 membrane protein [Vibrio tubiashii ATCC 19109]EGU59060.1 putative outer membrane receptor protein [Vibrio tubiashii ATCC 19109]EIF05937.1 outer membrane receptor protein [Vibrio tubiashii NCIMB 1337 = ATCC 19106]
MNSVMKINSFTGHGWGERATVQLSTGPTYEEIFLETNLTPEQIKRVSITLNADEIIVLDGQLMKMLEAYKGMPAVDGFYHIPLADITAKTKNGMRYTALVTEKGDNITLEVEIADKPAADAPDVQLKAHATVSPAQPARIVVPMIKQQTMQAGATENEFLTLMHGDYIFVRRLHFMTGQMNNLKISKDYIKLYDASRSVETMRAKRNKRYWQAGMYHFDPIMRGYYLDELFPTNHQNELKLTAKTDSVVNTIPILVEAVEVVRPDLIQ